jgi:hypothetical protein
VATPTLPTPAATLQADPRGDLVFIYGQRGQPLTIETFGTTFRDACRGAGVPKSAHGGRKTGVTRSANAGVTSKN